ncbi:MAG: hypothetical protein UY08_C0003G0021 [Candidatus Gottesmanbacteria bacterium GW2011_GWA1_47_8]|uniref:Glycosidase-related protein n=1 Tax=Candidatus Gottesmanbacteria bacterium GW2011_GWA1_47_8 TaxID=1618438 RepID=A0A0G1WFR1_9BACT|nr:MAG: hypothetical protein UY08_C0003G0021 [Candidatus Gottesmanbacteria bacterium GW2011_GWA1_47_8]
MAYLTGQNKPGTFSLTKSDDGFSFTQFDTVATLVYRGERYNLSLGRNFRVIDRQDKPRLSFEVGTGKDQRLFVADMTFVSSWKVTEEISTKVSPAVIYRNWRGDEWLVGGTGKLQLAKKQGDAWSKAKTILASREGKFDDQPLTYHHLFESDSGVFLLYHSAHPFIIGAAVLDKTQLDTVSWRADDAVWWQTPEWHSQTVAFVGALTHDDKIISYWQLPDGIFAVVYAYYRFPLELTTKNVSINLKKSEQNPILEPKAENAWESFNTFNPAAVYLNNRVHLLYRAQGDDWVSVLGYAASADGLKIDQRLNYPVYAPREGFEFSQGYSPVGWQYRSGGGYGGVEDPRLTRLGDRLYMTYVAYDGWNPPRVALTSISVQDFLDQRWFWEKPVLISPPGIVDKNCVIFPEKIKDKYVLFHRIFPDILLAADLSGC